MVTAKAALQVEPIPGRGSALVRWSGMGLVAASWFSAAAFAMYILAFYLGAIPAGHLEQWNNNLAGLYDKGRLTAFLAMSAHLATGAIILLLGPVQLIGSLRRRWPAVHRWIGRIYVFTAAVAGVGGLAFVISKGTIGGGPMNAGFGLYGALVLLAAVETWLQAVRGHYEVHRAWAIRLFALAIGSWLYRMDYGFWLLAVTSPGTHRGFSRPLRCLHVVLLLLTEPGDCGVVYPRAADLFASGLSDGGGARLKRRDHRRRCRNLLLSSLLLGTRHPGCITRARGISLLRGHGLGNRNGNVDGADLAGVAVEYAKADFVIARL